ncbi:alpha-amylase family glycosyl hydrolase [Parvularcula sp. LCG005]|uniref:alpha-amylase family glycosyl hydrolase n=1 Tax=Parvularcula sp. LCG005 TaxID=3078805 RepID=UPI002943EBFA|nr:alpha-amylase family glycosyl hydrolase [Parvularcula sp. LCG005]WOI52150.1 alpha-amylase family glycosyl hydrolase [Parvularcula sp. LCG005]
MTDPTAEILLGLTEDWWRGAVIYQIYPRSYQDSDGDGIGDLPGIIDRLDHVASLGVDGIWLSPFFPSPMDDFGYDISDYCGVDPMFGTLADFDRLVARAHDLGLKVIIDQVYSHTSDQHAWFEESRQDRTNDKADWFVWADPKEDGSPPNNWQSVFGGPAWAWEARRQQYYLHNFLTSQPDLNLRHPEVEAAILSVTRFWLDRGVDGFRLDALNFAMHDPSLRDNPPAPKEGAKLTRPFDYQLQTYNMSHPDIPEFLAKIRAVTDEYEGRFTVAEVGGVDALSEMKAFTAGNNRLNSAYNFDFLYADKLSSHRMRASLEGWTDNPDEGWPSWAFSNHDAPRAVSRWAPPAHRVQAAKLYAMLLLTLRGNVFLYQGEELGLPQAEVPFEKLKDPEAIANWPLTLGRDGARTPMPWRGDHRNGGFSDGDPWLPMDPRHLPLAVHAQEEDEHAVLHFIRQLIRMRHTSAALRRGSQTFLDTDDTLIAYWRVLDHEKVLCLFNIGEQEADTDGLIQQNCTRLVSIGLDEDGQAVPAVLPPFSGVILHCAPD